MTPKFPIVPVVLLAAAVAGITAFATWRAREPAAPSSATVAVDLRTDPFRLPGALTPDPQQARQLAQIRFRYGPILERLALDLGKVDPLRPDAAQERRFLEAKRRETEEEVARTIGLILTDEQRRVLAPVASP